MKNIDRESESIRGRVPRSHGFYQIIMETKFVGHRTCHFDCILHLDRGNKVFINSLFDIDTLNLKREREREYTSSYVVMLGSLLRSRGHFVQKTTFHSIKSRLNTVSNWTCMNKQTVQQCQSIGLDTFILVI